MRKKDLFCLLMVLFALLLGGCRNDKMPETYVADTVSTETDSVKPKVAKDDSVLSAVAKDTEKPAKAVRLQKENELPSGETYGIKYHLKINPEFDIYADNNLLIVEVQALNADAKELMGVMDIVGMDVISAVDYVVSESRTRGYMTEEKGNTVDLSIMEINETVMTECTECGGRGTVVCEDCHGTPFVACQACGGEKTHICGHCGGQMQSSTGTEDSGPVTCHNCNGSIWVDCENCNGTGRGPINCSHCGGSKSCQACGGSGYIDVTAGGGPDEGKVVGVDACYRCHGSGVCQNCKGASDSFCPNCCEHNGPDGSVRNPGGIPGKVMCRKCNGTGIEERSESISAEGNNEESCSYCSGSGYLLCEACGGTGGYRCGCELNGYNWCGSCHGSGVRNID